MCARWFWIPPCIGSGKSPTRIDQCITHAALGKSILYFPFFNIAFGNRTALFLTVLDIKMELDTVTLQQNEPNNLFIIKLHEAKLKSHIVTCQVKTLHSHFTCFVAPLNRTKAIVFRSKPCHEEGYRYMPFIPYNERRQKLNWID